MRTIVLTSDKGNWLLRGFLHQWYRYADRPIEIWGYTDPGEAVRGEATPFHSIGKFVDYPMRRWSDGAIRALEQISDDLVEIYLEDYWLMRKADNPVVELCQKYMASHPEAARFDLGTDRLYARQVRDVESIGTVDIIEAGGDYAFSWQASIWRRGTLLELMRPGETAWESELAGTHRLNEAGYRVFGTRQCPVRYMIAVNKGVFDRSGSWMYPPRSLNTMDWYDLDQWGYTTP